MTPPLSRRSWLATGLLLGIPARALADDAKPARRQSNFPRQDAKLVREVVGAAHSSVDRVRELITTRPALVNAAWDWGFGDWETPLGAAAHTGRRAIAELLLERGARIDIFAAAMLDMTDVVMQLVTARPGIQRTHGPHGIPLLAHAEAGEAAKTVEYLKSLGDAGTPTKTAPLDNNRKATFVGVYTVDDGPERFEVKVAKNGQLTIDVRGESETSNQRLNHLGDDEFFPSGAPSVRLKFVSDRFTLREGDMVIMARRANR